MVGWYSRKWHPTGLDWSGTALRAVQLAGRDRKIRVHALLEKKFPESFAADFSENDTDFGPCEQMIADGRMVDLLRQFHAMGGFAGREVVLHCPTDRLDLRPVVLPAGPSGLSRDAVLGAVRHQVAGHVPFDMESAILNYYPLEHDLQAGRLTVMALTADGSWIRQRVRCLEKAGLRCAAFEAMPFVMYRLLAYLLRHDPQYATVGTSSVYQPLFGLLDVSRSSSTLVVASHEAPLFCRRFAFGGREMTETLANQLLIPAEQAERLKVAYGLDYHEPHLFGQNAAPEPEAVEGDAISAEKTPRRRDMAHTIYNALKSSVEDFAEGLIRSLNYVITEQHDSHLERVFLSGSAGAMRGLDRFLEARFGVPVGLVNGPLLDELTGYFPENNGNSARWMTALALALPPSSGRTNGDTSDSHATHVVLQSATREEN